jgi:hypothetical protein
MKLFDKTFLFRMTYFENIPHIPEHGITHTNSPLANPDYVKMGDATRHNFS